MTPEEENQIFDQIINECNELITYVDRNILRLQIRNELWEEIANMNNKNNSFKKLKCLCWQLCWFCRNIGYS